MIKRKKAKTFRNLIVWQKAYQPVLTIYKVSKTFPNKELYGLTSQLRRSAVSIPANIVEGFKKISKPDKHRFMNIAQGSMEECRYYLILAEDLGYVQSTKPLKQLEEVSKLLNAYAKSILTSGS